MPLPQGLDPMLGIYAAHMGPIYVSGVLHTATEDGAEDLDAVSVTARWPSSAPAWWAS